MQNYYNKQVMNKYDLSTHNTESKDSKDSKGSMDENSKKPH